MKKIYLMALTTVFALSVNAQTTKKKTVAPEATNPNNIIAKKGNSVKKTTSVIWTDDFSNATTWTTNETAGATAWTFGTMSGQGTYSLGPIASTSAANGFALFDSDFGCDGDQIAHMTNATPFSCVGHPLVRLGFQQYYRRYVDSTFIYVSNNGTTWSKFVVNDTYADDDISPNPDNLMIDISTVAGNQATVWVRFTFYSPASLGAAAGCGYNWMIDDAFVEDIPSVDVQVKALGVLTSTSTVANNYNCNLGNQFVIARIHNMGLNTESNIPVNYSVNGAASTATVYAGSIVAGDSADIVLPMPFNFTPTNYYVVKAWTAYATDGNMSNDTSAIGITNTIPTPLTSTTYSNGIESNYDFYSLNLDYVSGLGYVFGPTATVHTGAVALYYTVPQNTVMPINEAMVVMPCMDVTTGDTYRISFWKRSNSGGMYGVFSGTAGQDAASMTDILKPYTAFTAPLGLWKKDSVDYVATANETRYFALGGKGDATSAAINVRYDDIKIWKVTGPTGVKVIAANDAISIFPNPTSGILNINAIEVNSSVEVYNVIGDKVYTATLVKGNNSLDLSGLANGAYFVKLNSNGQMTTKKVVLSK